MNMLSSFGITVRAVSGLHHVSGASGVRPGGESTADSGCQAAQTSNGPLVRKNGATEIVEKAIS